MKKIYTFILAIGLLISASNTFAQCTTTLSSSTNLSVLFDDWQWGSCTVELCIDYDCVCSSDPGCTPGWTSYQSCTTLSQSTTSFNYYSTPAPNNCCTFSITAVTIRKIPTSGPNEILMMPSTYFVNFQKLLDGSLTGTLQFPFTGTFKKDCNNELLKDEYSIWLTTDNFHHGTLVLVK